MMSQTSNTCPSCCCCCVGLCDICHGGNYTKNGSAVFYFDVAHPRDGWKQGPWVDSTRNLRMTTCVDGKIYLFNPVTAEFGWRPAGGRLAHFPFAHVFDTTVKEADWEPLTENENDTPPPFSFMLFPDPSRNQILFNSSETGLFAYSLIENKWKDLDSNFTEASPASVVLDGVLYYHRYSNCLNRYTKACKYPPEMSCPLCRGRVKNWSVDEPARQIFNSWRRSCVGDECPFVGTYRELRKHTREVHLSMKPQEVDPLMEQKWKKMEQESDSLDALSVVWSSMSQPVVMGDYVIDIGSEDSDGGEDDFDSDEGDAAAAAPRESHA